MSNVVTTKVGRSAPTTTDLADRQLGVDATNRAIYLRDGSSIKKVGDPYGGEGAVRYDQVQTLTPEQQQTVATAIGVGNIEADFAAAFEQALAESQMPNPVSLTADSVGFDSTGLDRQFSTLQEAVAYLLTHSGNGGSGSMALNEAVFTQSTIWTAPADGAVKLCVVGSGGYNDVSPTASTSSGYLGVYDGVIRYSVGGGSGAMATDVLQVVKGQRLQITIGYQGFEVTVQDVTSGTPADKRYSLTARPGRVYYAGGACSGGTEFCERNLGQNADLTCIVSQGGTVPHPLSKASVVFEPTTTPKSGVGLYGAGASSDSATYGSNPRAGGRGFVTLAFYEGQTVPYQYDSLSEDYLATEGLDGPTLETWLQTPANMANFNAFCRTYHVRTALARQSSLDAIFASNTASSAIFGLAQDMLVDIPLSMTATVNSVDHWNLLINSYGLSTLLGSAAGMAVVAGSADAVNRLLATPELRLLVAGSRVASNALFSNAISAAIIAGNADYFSSFFDPRGIRSFAVQSQVFMSAVFENTAASTKVLDSYLTTLQYPAAQDAFLLSTVAANLVYSSSTYSNNLAVTSGSPAALTYGSLITKIAASSIVMAKVAAGSNTLYYLFCNSALARPIFESSDVACTAIASSVNALTILAGTSNPTVMFTNVFKRKPAADAALASSAVMAFFSGATTAGITTAYYFNDGAYNYYGAESLSYMTSNTAPAGYSVSSLKTANANYPVWYAFDSSSSTSYQNTQNGTATVVPDWVEKKFPTPVAITKVQITGGSNSNYTWTGRIEYFDGSSWVPVTDDFTSASSEQVVVINRPVVFSNRWRVYISSAANSQLQIQSVKFSGLKAA
jgi:hypothetical protein